jgi:carbonic anhydrase
VRQSVKRITTDPFILVKDSVRGFVYDVTTGKLRELS